MKTLNTMLSLSLLASLSAVANPTSDVYGWRTALGRTYVEIRGEAAEDIYMALTYGEIIGDGAFEVKGLRCENPTLCQIEIDQDGTIEGAQSRPFPPEEGTEGRLESMVNEDGVPEDMRYLLIDRYLAVELFETLQAAYENGAEVESIDGIMIGKNLVCTMKPGRYHEQALCVAVVTEQGVAEGSEVAGYYFGVGKNDSN